MNLSNPKSLIEKLLALIVLAIAVFLIVSGLQKMASQEDNLVGEDPTMPDTALLAEIEEDITLPFYTRSPNDFNISTTYYVATNEPGASNTNCDGLAPTNEGNSHCPFENFNSQNVRNKLVGASGVKMYVREGYYTINQIGGDETGIRLIGNGDEFTPVILSGFPGETATLDAGETLVRADQIIAEKGEITEEDVRIRQLISMDGQYEIVEHLTIKNGFRHNILVLGPYNIIRHNILIGALEDSIKVTGDAHYGSIFDNDISFHSSQAVDYFGVDNWLIKNNDIHHPNVDPVSRIVEANGIGGKGGFTNLVITGNTIHDFDSSDQLSGAIVMGGTGDLGAFKKDSEGNLKPSAAFVIATNNTIYNYKGPAVRIDYCDTCEFSNNTIYDTIGAFYIGLLPEQDAEFSELPDNRNTVIRNNRFAGNHLDLSICGDVSKISLGDTCYAYFVGNLDSIEGLVSENNTYYTSTQARFVVADEEIDLLDHSDFKSRLNIDKSSIILPLFEFDP